MTNHPTPTTDAKKLEALFNEQRLRNAQRNNDASTFVQFANSEANAAHDRFAQINKATVTGSQPSVQYPKLPEASPWHSNPVPPEPSLGYPVDEVPIVGEEFEVRASLERAAQTGLPSREALPVEAAGSAEDHGIEPPPTDKGNEASTTKEFGVVSQARFVPCPIRRRP